MKRTVKDKENNFVKAEVFWGTVFCVNENMYIGVSKIPIAFLGGKIKQEKKHWKKKNCKFRNDDYFIDFSKVKPNQKVTCPVCGGDVDFRAIRSNTEPRFE